MLLNSSVVNRHDISKNKLECPLPCMVWIQHHRQQGKCSASPLEQEQNLMICLSSRQMTKGKSYTLPLNHPVRYMTSMFEKIKAYYSSLIIPQPSVLQKVMHRGTRTQRPAASSRENHCSNCGTPGHIRSHGSPITCPTLLQSHQQASKHH